ncbi:unnamed protein product [Hymenolepis diminuta]|uniref:Peptidase M3A/M3B catalytic domain-containing protein n=1 Tax=Hymenolepis diminuta TaxID=6216 RepID=A0A564YDS9_HYMDI|nr:unnamed protein product [Hymenolepis diminuta]
MLPRSRLHFVLTRLVRTSHASDPFTETKGQFYYVIPEIPTDTAKANPILYLDTLPKFEDLKVDKLFTGVSKQIIEYQVELSQLTEAIKSNSIPITYDNIVLKIDEIIFPVHYSFRMLQCLISTRNDPSIQMVYGRLYSKIIRAQCEHLYGNGDIYCALHKILLQLDPSETLKRGVIEQLLSECWANGAALVVAASDKCESCKSCSVCHFPHKGSKEACQKDLSQLFFLRSELMLEESTFDRVVTTSAYVSSPESMSQAAATGRFDSATKIGAAIPNYLANIRNATSSGYIPVAESDLSASAPNWFPYALGGKEEGGYIKGMRVNLGIDRAVQEFLRHCSNRELRRVAWHALVQRACQRVFGGSSGQHAANDNRIDRMRRLRSQVATVMGAKDWLSLVWRRSANSGRGPSNPDSLVDDYLEPLRKRLLPLGTIEWTILNEWAESHLRITSGLEAYDISYAISQYNFIMSLAPGRSLATDPRYERVLPLESTVDGVFKRIGELFGLTVARLPQGQGHSGQLGIPGSVVYEVVDNLEEKGFKLGEVLVNLTPKHHCVSTAFENVISVPFLTRFPVPSKSPSVVAAGGSISCMFGSLSPEAALVGLTEMEALDIASAFGNCLQHVVSRTPSYSYAGLTTPLPGISFAGSTSGIPIRDNDSLTQDLLKLLLLHSSALRRAIFGRSLSIDELSRDMPNLAHGINQIMALPLLKVLYESRFDLEMWGGGKSYWKKWQLLSEPIWNKHLPYPKHPDDQWACSAMGIFGANGIPGLRYSEIWRQIIAFDCFSAFTEAGVRQDHNSEKI